MIWAGLGGRVLRVLSVHLKRGRARGGRRRSWRANTNPDTNRTTYATPGVAQVKYILGLSIGRADKLVQQLELIFGALDQFK